MPCCPAACFFAVCAQDGAAALSGTSLASTGTYVGCVWSEYQVLQDNQRLKPSVASLTGSGLNFLVGRVSYTFGFQGAQRRGCGLALCAEVSYAPPRIIMARGNPSPSARCLAGPCIGMDTACSSSLVAAHLGHRALLDGETSASGAHRACMFVSCHPVQHAA